MVLTATDTAFENKEPPKVLAPKERPRLSSFAKGTEKETARQGVEGMVVNELLLVECHF